MSNHHGDPADADVEAVNGDYICATHCWQNGVAAVSVWSADDWELLGETTKDDDTPAPLADLELSAEAARRLGNVLLAIADKIESA